MFIRMETKADSNAKIGDITFTIYGMFPVDDLVDNFDFTITMGCNSVTFDPPPAFSSNVIHELG